MDVVLCFIENTPSYKNQADSIFKKYRIPPAAGGGVAHARNHARDGCPSAVARGSQWGLGWIARCRPARQPASRGHGRTQRGPTSASVPDTHLTLPSNAQDAISLLPLTLNIHHL